MWKLFLKIFIPLVVVVAVVVPIAVVFTRSVEGDSPMVNTTVGMIRGLESDDGSYSMFLGIPYAVVDKSNPFGTATAHPTFDDVFNAFEDTVRCPQSGVGSILGSLDCLQLNVYVPNTDKVKPLPVLVYIHGGRFIMGSSAKRDYAPTFLLRRNVVYVSLHYRLTAYGFMCLHTPQVPGNQGLKDQLAALRWIKRNIRAFGGDDENITIFGDSAGGVSVDMQLLNADEGLFHKAIIQSGTSLSPWGIEGPDLDAPFKLCRHLGFATSDLNEAVAFLSNQTVERVMQATSQLSIRFTPCVEKEFPNVESFMTVHPVSTPIPRAKSIPIMAGYNDDERLMTYANMPDHLFDDLNIFERNTDLGFQFGEKHEAMKAYIRRFYAGDEPMSSELRRPVTDFESDFLFVHPTQRTLGKYLASGGVAYHYVFTYLGGRNMMRIRLNITTGRASHSDELGYLFDLPSMTETPTPDDQLIIDRITTLWTNFAKYGDPTPSSSALLPVKWLPVTTDRLNYLNLTKELEIRTRPFSQRLGFWDFFYDINEEYVRGYSNLTFTKYR